MRYQVMMVRPGEVKRNAAGFDMGSVSDATMLAQTNDLELAWLILNWAGECRLMPNERMGVWDCTLKDWRAPEQVAQER